MPPSVGVQPNDGGLEAAAGRIDSPAGVGEQRDQRGVSWMIGISRFAFAASRRYAT